MLRSPNDDVFIKTYPYVSLKALGFNSDAVMQNSVYPSSAQHPLKSQSSLQTNRTKRNPIGKTIDEFCFNPSV